MPERVYLCDDGFVCEHCAEGVDDSDSVAPGSETDRPQHCSYCHCPLFTFIFTPECVQYVYQTVREHLRAGTADNGWRWESGYYEGMGKEAVLREWTAHVLQTCFRLDRRVRRTLQLYMYFTAWDVERRR